MLHPSIANKVPVVAVILNVKNKDEAWVVEFGIFNQRIIQSAGNVQTEVAELVVMNFFGVEHGVMQVLSFAETDSDQVDIVDFVVVT